MNCKISLLVYNKNLNLIHLSSEKKKAFQTADGLVTKTDLNSGRQGEKCAL